MQVHKIDTNGFFLEDEIISPQEIVPKYYVTVRPPQGMYKPRWTGVEWIEGKTEEEFLEDAFLTSLNPSQQELAKAERELETIELLIEMGLI